MFNYVEVTFPETTIQPAVVYSATLYQNRYEHEVVVLRFRDWGIEYDAIESGSPVHIVIKGTDSKRDVYGYVHHVKADRTPGTFFSEVVIVGGSFPMKQESQAVFTNTTADQVIKKIAKKHNFTCYATPHPRVYPQIAQAGQTDWQLMSRLAKQCGYSLRAENTELYFHPVMSDYTKYRTQARKFTMRHESSVEGSTLYSFDARVGESIKYEDGYKAAVAVSGVDPNSGRQVSVTQQIRNKKTKKTHKPEFFDKFNTSVVVDSFATAKHEAKAAEDMNSFPYRATATVLGEPDLRPDMPVYLEGISSYYDGYWVILGTEHKFIETEKNTQTYVTVLHVGTDSLGTATTWTDGALIKSPDYRPVRIVIPNVRQTNKVPKSNLIKTSVTPSPQTPTTFGVIGNRTKNLQTKSYWKSSNTSSNNVSSL